MHHPLIKTADVSATYWYDGSHHTALAIKTEAAGPTIVHIYVIG